MITASCDSIEQQNDRFIAVTIDDLPVVGGTSYNDRLSITNKIVTTLVQFDIPATGFVNEINLNRYENVTDEINLLRIWLDAGLDLANHTYAHMDFSVNSLVDFKMDVINGEKITKPLMDEYGMELVWFRYPYLRIGADIQKRKDFEQFLTEHNYKIAPITIDNADWFYNNAYEYVLNSGDKELANRVADDYVRYMTQVFEYSELLSSEALGYELPQILLIHSNRLNADHFHRVAAMIIERGYTFVHLDQALENYDYIMPDGTIEPTGTNWLNQKLTEQNKAPRYRPDWPGWINTLGEAGSN